MYVLMFVCCCAAAAAWERIEKFEMKRSAASKYRPLLLAALALIACRSQCGALGLSHNTEPWGGAGDRAMGSISVSATPVGVVRRHLVRHGAYAAGLMQLNWFRARLAALAAVDDRGGGRSAVSQGHHRAPRRLFLAADAGAGRARLHHAFR